LDKYTRWVAVAYIRTSEGQLRNFNKMLVDAGHAVVKDYKDNEFDPRSWWV
jgi:micrococcal nuclease